jgi:hypothetical protein
MPVPLRRHSMLPHDATAHGEQDADGAERRQQHDAVHEDVQVLQRVSVVVVAVDVISGFSAVFQGGPVGLVMYCKGPPYAYVSTSLCPAGGQPQPT